MAKTRKLDTPDVAVSHTELGLSVLEMGGHLACQVSNAWLAVSRVEL